MDANQYQQLALVTEFTPDFVRLEGATPEHNRMVAQLIHAVLGLASEVGEVADALKKHIIYGRELDRLNVIEEIGDLLWYEALALTATKAHLQSTMEMNITKLRTRYGSKFDAFLANNRNLDAERASLAAGEYRVFSTGKTVAMPQTHDEAHAMLAVAQRWLRDNGSNSLPVEFKDG